jgi:hypothetical protein
MAVSATHYTVVRHLFMHGLLPQNGALLELGEANWYGDVEPQAMVHDINRFVADPARRAALVERLSDVIDREGEYNGFAVMKVFYEIFFAPSEFQAIDPEGMATAHRFDLNNPVTLNRQFEVVINHGTAEHIFNVAQVFETMHRFTAPGGLMIHESQFHGWIDHGFYNLQPSLFFDVAEQNGYRLTLMVVADIENRILRRVESREDVQALLRAGQIPQNASLFTAMHQSAHERPFEQPRCGG